MSPYYPQTQVNDGATKKVGLSPIFKFEGLGVSVMRTNYSRSTKIRTSCETSGAVVANGSWPGLNELPYKERELCGVEPRFDQKVCLKQKPTSSSVSPKANVTPVSPPFCPRCLPEAPQIIDLHPTLGFRV